MKWRRDLLRELNLGPQLPTVIKEDTSGTIARSQNEKSAKHVDIRYRYVKLVKNRLLDVKYCPTRVLTSDIFRKAMPCGKFEEITALLGMYESDSDDNIGKETFAGV